MPKQWISKNVRITVTTGPLAGQNGKAVRSLGRGEWMVKLDGRMFGTTVRATDMTPER